MTHFRQSIRFNHFLLIVFPALLILSSLLFIYPVFQSSDDAWQSLMNAGYVFWDYPMVNPIITSPGFTSIVVMLNSIFPFFSWHGLVLIFFHYLILVAIFRLLLNYQSFNTSVVLFILYFFLIHLNYLAFLHYTTTGLLMCSLGIILIFYKTTKTKYDLVFGGILFLIGSFLRPEAAILSIILLGWIFIIPLFSQGLALLFSQLKKLTVLVVLTISINLIFYLVNNNDGSWSNYLNFHYKYAKPILDNDFLHYDSTTSPLYHAIGWSENDYNMLTNWYFGDTVTFNYKKIAKLYELASLTKNNATLRNWANGMEEINFHFRQSQYFNLEFGSFILLFSILVFSALKGKSIRPVLIFFPSLLISAVLLFYLAFFMKLPPWVIQPIVAVLIVLIFNYLPEFQIPKNLKTQTLIFLSVSIITIGIMKVYYNRGLVEKAKFESFRTFINQLQPSVSDVYWITTDLPLTSVPALVDLRFLKDLKGYPVTTICQTPFAFKRIEQRKMGNPSHYLFESPKAKALCTEKFCIMYKTYVKEHFNKDIEYMNTMPYTDFGKSFGVYQFKEVLN